MSSAADKTLDDVQATRENSATSVSSSGGKPVAEPLAKKKGFFPFGKKKSNKKKDDNATDAEKNGFGEKMDYSGLSQEDADLLRGQTDIPKQKAGILTLYQYAGPVDWLILAVGFFFAIVHGAALPMFTLVVGSLTNNFNSFVATGSLVGNAFQHTVNHNALYFVYIGVGITVSGALESMILVYMGEVLSSRYRKAYLRAIIRQNIAYFDKLGSGEVSTRITNDTTAIQEAISEKAGNIISGIATFVAALAISFASNAKLAAILLSGVFYIIFTMVICSTVMVTNILQGEKVYSTGSSIAEEALGAIRNTVAFGIQERLANKFDKYLQENKRYNQRKNWALAIMLGLLWSGIFWFYALAFWEGSRLIAEGHLTIGKIVAVLTAMLIGAFQIGNIAPNFQFVAKGIAAASSINETVRRVPVIDALDEKGQTLPEVYGRIDLNHVSFRYPSRPDVLVLPDFSLTVEPGQTVALVGASGSGKSTIIGLLERFYLPLAGTIKLDGVNIEDLNVRWLRQQVSLVSQEPTLFPVSIYENIAYGLIGTEFEEAPEEVKREKVAEAARVSNAYDFIQQLTEGFDTNVGDRGFLLSGGQKQRIAIARAVISNPKILLLDEATSALDTKSEGIVQEALDRASKSRSTIVIAHRLSTIKDADRIVVMSKGEIVEVGNHQELLAKQGVYHRLVNAQQVTGTTDQRKGVDGAEDGYVDGPSGEDTDNEAPAPLLVQEDAFVQEEALSRTGTRQSKAGSAYGQQLTIEDRIPGMQKGPTKLRDIISMLWRLNQKEHSYIALGGLTAGLLGMGYPALAMIMGRTIQSIMVPPTRFPEMRRHVNLYSGMFFMVGCEQLVAGFCMIMFLSWAAEGLLRNVRLQMFRQFMRMDIAYFDHKDNSSGSLVSILAKDGKAIEGLGGATFGMILDSLVILVAGIITGIAFAWKLGLVGLACVPILVGGGFLRLFILTKLQERGRKVFEDSGAMATQFATAVRTVQTLTREPGVQKVYNDAIDIQVRGSRWSIVQSAILFGLSEGCTPWILALVFWYGSTQLRDGKIGIFAYYVVFIAVVFGAQSAGSVFSYVPDMGKARQSSGNVLRVLTAQPEIDTWSEQGLPVSSDTVEGNIQFENVHFRYPTRPQVPVLRGVDFSVNKGQFVALVGPSGSGKSTTIGLIERFYNPLKGAVTLDGTSIDKFNINQYRNQIALVQQEPMLYSGTIKDNILMGWNGEDESEVTQAMIEDAARMANIHDFIMSLPEGYETSVGSRGGLLSGGQKQRIAIARALIRDPKVLLLDEATSALDSESEKVVQAALDVASQGRTTIAVAHRLSTIRNADIIYVFENGVIAEKGKHDDLLALNGRYAELVRLQSLEN